MQYYLFADGRQTGPVDEAKLLSMGVTRETLVWCAGMQQWQPAGALPELSYLFARHPDEEEDNVPPPPPPSVGSIPPAPPQERQSATTPAEYDYDECPKTYLLESILVTIFCCLPLGAVGIFNAAGVSSAYGMGDIRLAMRRSDNAKKWTLLALVVGLVCHAVWWLWVWLTIRAQQNWIEAVNNSYYY